MSHEKQCSESFIWGSINDSSLLRAIDDSTKKPSNNVETDRDTDADTDEDEHEGEGETNTKKMKDEFPIPVLKPANDAIVAQSSASTDWGSMNDSQFISFVNKISQSRANCKLDTQLENAYPTVEKESELQHDNSELHDTINDTREINSGNITSSPVLFAQTAVDLNSVPDIIEGTTKEDLEDAGNFAFDNYETYFEAKKQKQDIQAEQLSKFVKGNNNATADDFPPIFANCAIHVNGRTDPDILQLRKMIVLYGGKYVHFLSSKGSVTHIVAESLPPRKRIQFGNCKVVSPKWIVESIEKKKLLPWSDYRLKQLMEYGQQSIPFTKVDNHNGDDCVGSQENDDEMNSTADKKQDDPFSTEDMSKELQIIGMDAKHPDFIKTFFAKSRLHHLSTWKSELRSNFLNRAIRVLKAKNMERSSSKKRIILHVDFDCFFATVSAQLQTPAIDISSVPCCVAHGGKSADISSCNYVARSFGVKNGMWMSQAKELCPNIICLPYQFEEYENRSQKFYEKLLSLKIDSILPVSVDEALLDITTLCKEDNRSIFEIVSKIKEELDSLTKCTLSCGVGSNVLTAKLALRNAKPNGVFVAPEEHKKLLDFLNTVEVSQLPGVGRKLISKFETLFPTKSKITLLDLRSVDKSKLMENFGNKLGEKLYEYCRGEDPTSIDILKEPEKFLRKSVNIDINWGIRFDNDSQVEAFLFQISKELNKRLLEAGMVGSLLTLKLSLRHPQAPIEPAKYLGMGRCTFTTKSARLGVCTREIGVISMELKFLLRFLNVKAKELRGIGVSMTKLITDDEASAKDVNQMKLPFGIEQFQKNRPDFPVNKTDKLETKEPLSSPVKIPRSPHKGIPSVQVELLEIDSQEIDWEVFDNLPLELQNEIKSELRRRRLRSSPKKKRPLNNGKDITTLLSPRKRTPISIRYPKSEFGLTPEKIKERKENIITFQGCSIQDITKIIEKIYEWMNFTLQDGNVIDDMDMELFRDFMLKLLSGNELLKFIKILKLMKAHLFSSDVNLDVYQRWCHELESLQSLFDQQSLTRFEFTF